MRIDRPVSGRDLAKAEADLGRPLRAMRGPWEGEPHLHAFVGRATESLAAELRGRRVGAAALATVRAAVERVAVTVADAVKLSRDFRHHIGPTGAPRRPGAGEPLIVDRVVYLGVLAGTAGPSETPVLAVSVERVGDVIDHLGFVEADALLLAESLMRVLSAAGGEGCARARRELGAFTEPGPPAARPAAAKPAPASDGGDATRRARETQLRRLRQVRVDAAMAVLKDRDPNTAERLRADMARATGHLEDAGVGREVTERVLGEVLRTAARALGALRHEYLTVWRTVAGDEGIVQFEEALRRHRRERRQDGGDPAGE